MLSIRKRLKSVYKKIKISTLFIYLVIFFLMPIICKAESINQINNKEELSVYLVKKNLNLIEDQTLFENKWFEQLGKENVFFKFNLDGTGKEINIRSKYEKKFIWKTLDKTSFSYRQFDCDFCGWAVMNLDFEKKIAEGSRLRYKILPAIDVSKIEKEVQDKEVLLKKYHTYLDNEFIKKDGKKYLNQIIIESLNCLESVRNQYNNIGKTTHILSKDFYVWRDRAISSINNNNISEMRLSYEWLRRLSFEAFSATSTDFGANNSAAKYCRSIDNKFNLNFIEFDIWKKKN